MLGSINIYFSKSFSFLANNTKSMTMVSSASLLTSNIKNNVRSSTLTHSSNRDRLGASASTTNGLTNGLSITSSTLSSKNHYNDSTSQPDLAVFSSSSMSYSNLSNPSRPSLMNGTKTSLGKSVHTVSNSTIGTTGKLSSGSSIYSSSSHSTHYHPISSSSASNLLKNSVISKKNPYY